VEPRVSGLLSTGPTTKPQQPQLSGDSESRIPVWVISGFQALSQSLAAQRKEEEGRGIGKKNGRKRQGGYKMMCLINVIL
jgi:hypothetical protein